MAMNPFLWGAGGAQLTPEEIATQRAILAKRRLAGVDTSPVAHWTQGAARIADALGDVLLENRLNQSASANKAADDADYGKLVAQLTGNAPPPTSGYSGQAAPITPVAADVSKNGETFAPFIDALRPTITNPYGLAAVASTGRAESGWSPTNAARTWADPSQSGQPGTAGGILSWRGPRLVALQNFAKANGESGNGSPQTQAKFFAQESPDLIAALNSAKSIEEAQSAINKAWAFAGYDKPSAEVARRLGYANAYLPQFQGQSSPPQNGYVDTAVVSRPQQPTLLPESPPSINPAIAGALTGDGFDNGRFGSAKILTPDIYSTPSDFQPSSASESRGIPSQSSLPAITQAPSVLPTVRFSPEALNALGSSYASPRTQQVAKMLIEQQASQNALAQKANMANQQRQQEIQQRVSVAKAQGIDPAAAYDDELWKASVGQKFAAPSTVTIGNNVYDTRNPSQPIITAPQAPQPLMNLGNGTVYDPNTKSFVQSPNNIQYRQANPDEIKAFGTNGQVGPDGRFYPVTPPQGTALSVDPNTGAVTFNQGPGVKPLTEGQSKDSFFTTRMTAALPSLEANEKALLSLGGKLGEAIPMNLGNYAQSEEYQLARDAGRDFVTAYLRKDSGAALTPSEEKIYGELLLPQPGDKPATIELKRQRRQVAVEAIKSGMPPQALDGVVKAIKAVPGADKPIETGRKTKTGVQWSID